MLIQSKILAPEGPLPAGQCPQVAAPLVRKFVAWLKHEFSDETVDAVESEHLYLEFASVEDELLLERAVLFEHLAANGVVQTIPHGICSRISGLIGANSEGVQTPPGRYLLHWDADQMRDSGRH